MFKCPLTMISLLLALAVLELPVPRTIAFTLLSPPGVCSCSPWYVANDDTAQTSTSNKNVVEYNDFLPEPNPNFQPLDVLSACMTNLHERQALGLDVCWRFSSDRCRAALGGSLTRFAEYATNPVFGYLVQCADYTIVNMGPIIAGTSTRGEMQTILMETKASDDEARRRFLWTFQKERRPPRQNCWVIHEVIYIRNAFALTE